MEAEGNYIATRATERLTKADYDKLLPLLVNQVRQNQKIRWYLEMEDFEGKQKDSFFEDVNFDIEHARDMEKVAMVGNEKWARVVIDFMNPFTAADIKYFDISRKEEAKEWLKIS